jgi:hypothetical protein
MRALIPLVLLVAAASAQEAKEPASEPRDPVLTRNELLARLDAQIDAEATRAHLEARLILDNVMPLPYLGVDAEADGGGMRVTKVYPMTGAQKAGIREGDVILVAAGKPTPDAAALGSAIRLREVGGNLLLKVSRDGKEMDVTTELGRRPEEDEDEEEQFPALFPAAPAPPLPLALDLMSDGIGDTPKGIECILAGHGRPGKWIVADADGKRALRQADGDPTGIRFPIALVKGLICADAVATVRLRLAGGDFDRAAGVVLRYRDTGNYLVARVNATENDLRIFRVANGIRRTLPGGRVEIPKDDGKWHTLVFRAEGPRLVATYDGKFESASYDTYLTRGAVGLWTKSDSVSDFADLEVKEPEAKGAPGD